MLNKRRDIPKGRCSRIRYKGYESSTIKRVIKDGYDGKEFIVVGDENTTFGEACKNHWQFEGVGRNSGWFIKDARGNDVTGMSLNSYDGISILIPEYGSEVKEKVSDKSDDLYSIHDSVTYYD